MRISLVVALSLVAMTACSKAKDPCDGTAPRVPLRLLTRAEYDNTIRDLLGNTTSPAKDFPREPLAKGWDNDGTLNQVTDESVTRYLEAAEAIAQRATESEESIAAIVPCSMRNAACGKEFIRTFGRRAYRRSLNDEELGQLSSFFETTLNRVGFNTATQLTLEVMLQSPQFLYRVEEGKKGTTAGERVPLEGVELASRLSYFIWASMPDDALLEAAEKGELADPEKLKAQASRMVADKKSLDGKLRFFSLWLRVDDVRTVSKAKDVYPTFTDELPNAWGDSLTLFLKDIIRDDGTLKGLLTSNAMYVNNSMSMYANASTSSFQKVMMPLSERSGVLTQPGFLARLASPDQSSPIRRGIFVLDKLMCQPPPPPPADLNAVPPKLTVANTTRKRFAAHTESSSCRSCHSRIDPLGFGFEHFDGMGVWRDMEGGEAVDSSGEVVGTLDEQLKGPFNGATELSQRLAESTQVSECFSQQWMRFAMGRELGTGDACSLTAVQTAFSINGSFDDLVMAIVMSDSFRTRPAEVTP